MNNRVESTQNDEPCRLLADSQLQSHPLVLLLYGCHNDTVAKSPCFFKIGRIFPYLTWDDILRLPTADKTPPVAR